MHIVSRETICTTRGARVSGESGMTIKCKLVLTDSVRDSVIRALGWLFGCVYGLTYFALSEAKKHDIFFNHTRHSHPIMKDI